MKKSSTFRRARAQMVFCSFAALSLLLLSSFVTFSATFSAQTTQLSKSPPQGSQSTPSIHSSDALQQLASSISTKFQSFVGSLKSKLNLRKENIFSSLQPSIIADPPSAVNYAQTPDSVVATLSVSNPGFSMYDPANGDLYISGDSGFPTTSSNGIYIVDSATNAIVSTILTPCAYGMA
ncbi:MAG: hypothetical protein JRN52_16335, partial [Nitrososphaerota archaeon]|nr:hypothetical protein [Nitrososphaerota archaeon]